MACLRVVAAAAAFAVVFVAAPARAAAVYAFLEVGNNVVGTLSGGLTTAGATGFPQIGNDDGPGFGPSGPSFGSGANAGQAVTLYPTTNPGPFGPGLTANVTSVFGIVVSIVGPSITLPSSYVSGSEMDGTMIFENASFASLGVTLGNPVWTLSNGDTFALRFTRIAAAIPTPASLPVLAGALGLLWLAAVARRRGRGAGLPAAPGVTYDPAT
jgi:hypothetical protein